MGIQGASRVARSGDVKVVLRQRKDWIIKNLSIASVTLTCSISRDVHLTPESLSLIRFVKWNGFFKHYVLVSLSPKLVTWSCLEALCLLF